MVQSICGKETAEKNRNKEGVTKSDGCNGILDINASSENTVTGEEKGWLDGGEICDMCRRGYKAWEDSRAVSVEYLALYDKYFIGWAA